MTTELIESTTISRRQASDGGLDASGRAPAESPVALPTTAEWLSVVLALLVCLGLGAVRLDLPMLHEDAAIPAVASLRVLTGLDVPSEGWFPVSLAHRAWPVLLTPTQGALISYVNLPALMLFGVSMTSWRLGLLAWAGLGVLLMWWFGRTLCRSREIAWLAAGLTVTHPSFLLWCRQGFADVLSLGAFFGALLLALAWSRGGSRRLLYPAAFCVGLGFYSRSVFMAFLLATAIATRLWAWPTLTRRIRELPQRIDTGMLCLYAFLAGAFGRLWYAYHTVSLVPSDLALWGGKYVSTVVANYPSRVINVFVSCWHMLTGGWSAGTVDYMGGPTNYLITPLLLVALPSSLLAVKVMPDGTRRLLGWLATLILLVCLIMPLAPQMPAVEDLFLLLPCIHLLLAVWILAQRTMSAESIMLRRSLLVVVAGLFGLNVLTAIGYGISAVRTEGAGDFSSAYLRCARDLDSEGIRRPVTFEWGIRHRFLFVTQGRVRPEQRPLDALPALMEQAGVSYVFRVAPDGLPSTYEQFHMAAARLGKAVVLDRVYRQRDGVPVVLTCSLRDRSVIDGQTRMTVRASSPEGVMWRRVAIHGDERHALIVQPSNEVRIPMRLPAGARLEFSTGIPENCWGIGDGAMGTLAIAAGGQERLLFSQHLAPQHRDADRQWFQQRVDMSAFAGQFVELVLRSFPGETIGEPGGDYNADWFAWTDLRVNSDAPAGRAARSSREPSGAGTGAQR